MTCEDCRFWNHETYEHPWGEGECRFPLPPHVLVSKHSLTRASDACAFGQRKHPRAEDMRPGQIIWEPRE